jgi:lambda family phage tail tape measure protein
VASRSLGTLTLDLVAKIGGFVAGMDAAERKADSTARAIARKQAQRAKEMEKLAVGIGAAVGAIAAAAGAAFVAIDQLAKSAANFKDLEETTGASAEGLASMAVAAATAGVSMDTLAANSIRLTKGLMGVDGESKAAAAGIKALGLNLADFKKLDPVGQTDALTKAFAGFADGQGKTAVATALWGKSGAEMLKVMKALDEQGGRNVILTQQQIELADQYADQQASATAELKQYAQVAAIQALPAIIALVKEFSNVIKEITGLDKQTASLAANSGIRQFAEDSAVALGYLIDDIRLSAAQLVSFIATTKAEYGALKVFLGGPLVGGDAIRDMKRYAEEAGKAAKAVASIAGQKGVADRLKDRFRLGLGNGERGDAFSDPRSLLFGKKPTLPELALGGGGGKKAKKEIDEVKKALEELNKELAIFGQDDDFKKALEFEALGPTNAQLVEYKKNLQELKRLKAHEEIEEVTKALEKERDEFGLSADQLKIQELLLKGASQAQIEYAQSIIATTQAMKDNKALAEAKAAADEYLESIKRAQAAELQGFGVGNRERQRISGRLGIEDKFEQQRRDLNRARLEASLAGNFGADQQRRYEQELAIIRSTQQQALEIYEQTYQRRTELEADWSMGASEAAANYLDSIRDVSAQVDDAFTSAFQGMEDALVKFITTGKLDFKSLADSILADITRIIIKQQIMGPLVQALGLGGPTPVGGNFFSSLFAGKFADGGYIGPGQWGIVGEEGPEAAFGGRTGMTVQPNQPGRPINVNVNQTFAPGTSRATVDQAAAASGRAVQRAMARGTS